MSYYYSSLSRCFPFAFYSFPHLLVPRYADDNLNRVAAELDSFDGRKDPERCAALVSRLRSCQDKLLNICTK
jgi:hypothetical protein